jgi:hypothetical protein
VGAKNYKNDVLIPIIAEILPNGEYGWEAIAIAYQEQSREPFKRNTNNIKRHWIRNLCKSLKKPTGKPGEANDRILRCIAIERKIMEKTHSGLLGIMESNAEDRRDDEEGGGSADEEIPWRRSPTRTSKTQANQCIRSQLASTRVPTAEIVLDEEMIAEWNRQRDDEDHDEYHDRIDRPPDHIVEAVTRSLAESDGSFRDGAGEEDGSPFLPSRTQSVSNALRRAAEMTPPMEKSVRDAMIWAESFAKAQKMKNFSNKSKERASVAGTIVKMLDRMDSSTNESLGAQMNLMIMNQLEEMNGGMAWRAREERREKAKEKKRRHKRQEKKRAMRVAK